MGSTHNVTDWGWGLGLGPGLWGWDGDRGQGTGDWGLGTWDLGLGDWDHGDFYGEKSRFIARRFGVYSQHDFHPVMELHYNVM